MYYVEPSIAMKMSSFNGIGSSSQNNSSNSASSSNMSSSSSTLIKNKFESPLSTNSTENNNIKVYSNGNLHTIDKPVKPVLNVDPFAPAQISQPQTSFANFDNASIFNATSTVPGYSSCNSSNPVQQTSPPPPPRTFLRQNSHSNYSHTNRWSTGSLMSAPLSSSPAVPTEDRYAALKDLDCLMKSQNAAKVDNPTQETIQHAVNSDPWGNGISSSTQNGLWSTIPVVKAKETTNLVNGFASNPFANDNWASENGFNNGESSKNPFKNSKLFSDWTGTNGSSDMTTSQSLGTFQWLSSNHANPFAVGGFSGSPPTNSAYHSSNPFL